jgi:ElaB/YqjD/DUF883 family membrane-anchored ribosome-binding protein
MSLHIPNLASSQHTLDQLSERAADKAGEALESTRTVANDTIDKLQSGVQDLRDKAPGTLSRTAAQLDELARRTADRARETTAQARERVAAAGESAVGHVRDEPVKALLIAALAGAAAAALVGYLSRHRAPDRH